MKRALVALALALAGLVLWERGLVAREASERAARSRVGHLVPPERRAELTLSALRVERAGEPVHVYARVRGRWRVLDQFLAPADGEALGRLAESLLDAQGFVVSDEPSEAEAYGIVGPDALRVSLCGPRVLEDPGGDVQVAFDLGASVAGQEGSFVRQRGAREIWAIDSDPRALLASPAPGLAPLLERWVVPADWKGWQGGLARIGVRRAAGAGGAGFVLERRMLELAPEELQAGRTPWEWILAPGASERPAAAQQAQAFSLFVQRLPYAEVLDPARAAELTGAGDELTLEAAEAPPLVLRFGPPLPDGRVPVWNEESGALLAMPAEPAALALPDVELFLTDSDANPWDPWLR